MSTAARALAAQETAVARSRDSSQHVGAYLRPQRVDGGEPATGFDVPEGPAVAGLEALGDRTDAVD
jgi:hypothetical protein